MIMFILAGLTAFILTLVGIPIFMRWYRHAHIAGQQMHEDVKQHQAKAGTPTMGGTVFLLAMVVVTLIYSFLVHTLHGGIWAMISVLLIYGFIGFWDDFVKIFRHKNEGLTPIQKFSLQVIGALFFYFLHVRPSGIDSINFFGIAIHLGLLYLVFVVFWLVGFSNAVNLTDGIDGLATISVVISLVAYAFIAIKEQNFDVLLMIATAVGALLAFFVFNHKPAKIFMGDVGSLALGALLAAISISLHREWTLLLVGIIYILETASVMLQVLYFKWTKKRYGEGRRIFRMTPLHHHFELGGFTGHGQTWSEWQVDGLFWTINAIGSVLALLIVFLK